MRKWIVAGVALVVIAVGAYLLAQPKKGSVEWHKERLLDLDAHLDGRSLWTKIDVLCFKVFGKRFIDWSEEVMEELTAEVRVHQLKLRELGYLVPREYMFTNTSPEDSETIQRYLRPEIDSWERALPSDQLCWIEREWWNNFKGHGPCFAIRVIAPREYQPDWDEAVRKVNEKLRAK